MKARWPMIVLAVALAGWAGYWLASTAVPERVAKANPANSDKADGRRLLVDDPAPRFRSGDRGPQVSRDDEALDAGALPGQRNLVFSTPQALDDFLKRAGERVRIMGRIDALNALRVGFLNADDLAFLLDSETQASFVYPVDLPAPPEGVAQDGAVALGAGLLDWLGISGDNSAWGSGVVVAILDTGVTANSAFSSKISMINLVDLPSDPAAQNGHGTGVASMIIGNGSLTPGVAPGTSIVSVRIANDLGQSDSFLLAQGIVAAVDAGARLINISLGSPGDSALVRNAIEYANSAGSMIVAATGNNGVDRISYPAANRGVIAVGAVDAVGNHLGFSNSGPQLALAAPGFGVNAAWSGDQAASVSGTSFSSPIVAGAIAAVMSQPGSKSLTNHQALALINAYLNDAGAEGGDEFLGAGMPDLGRVKNRDTRGIYDAALASQRVLPPTPGNPNGQIEVLVQNRGTEALVNTKVQISTPTGKVVSNITSLPVNGVKAIRVPITQAAAGSLRYESRVTLSTGLNDAKPSNDRRVESYAPAVSK
ncbi:MAG: S8 family peptidase [Luteolibacter sp.]